MQKTLILSVIATTFALSSAQQRYRPTYMDKDVSAYVQDTQFTPADGNALTEGFFHGLWFATFKQTDCVGNAATTVQSLRYAINDLQANNLNGAVADIYTFLQNYDAFFGRCVAAEEIIFSLEDLLIQYPTVSALLTRVNTNYSAYQNQVEALRMSVDQYTRAARWGLAGEAAGQMFRILTQ